MSKSLPTVIGSSVKIALVGCGRISKNHIRSIATHNDRTELVALCDVDMSQMQCALGTIKAASEEFPGFDCHPRLFNSFDELLASVASQDLQLDLVVLTTPSGLHPSQTIKASQLSLNVCTEKPMATKWQDGQDMVRACDEAKVNLFVVKQNRFNSTLQLVKRQILSGRFGRLSMVSVNVFWQRPQSYYDQAEWRGTWEFDGGALMNQASHYIDLLDWLIGPVECLSASTATIARDIEAEDTAALQLRWRNGALGTMSVSMLTYPKNLEGSITILGEKGTIKVGGPAVNKIEEWSFADSSPDDSEVSAASYETTSVYGFGHPAYYSNMLDALQGKTQPECDGREGLKSLELIIGAYRSARDGVTTHFPLDL